MVKSLYRNAKASVTKDGELSDLVKRGCDKETHTLAFYSTSEFDTKVGVFRIPGVDIVNLFADEVAVYVSERDKWITSNFCNGHRSVTIVARVCTLPYYGRWVHFYTSHDYRDRYKDIDQNHYVKIGIGVELAMKTYQFVTFVISEEN